MFGLQIAVTPPHPPPSEREKAESISLERLIRQRSGPVIVKTIIWLCTLADVAYSVAGYTPTLTRQAFRLWDKDISLCPTSYPPHPFTSPMLLVGCFVALLGGCLRLLCYKELGSMFTFEMSIRTNHRLITSGPYSYVRHPGYVGVILSVVGVALWHSSPGSWAIECGLYHTRIGCLMASLYVGITGSIIFALLRRMYKEDDALRQEFGPEWEIWAEEVPFKLIPGLI
ncbi:ICMT-domain-containing protein [Fistulina hepatica ATCC 64428]|uniref:Protein-S-isoprenylcysteine O-methyltransferase n=1 Tax=Fistulina hepatica ATCC 64428 TaxID=1128425 RepID=A0A0D7A0Y1_9AGAR|nr:ICMT-domain-containing protein [Fistulina hepatica ATCC 64428]